MPCSSISVNGALALRAPVSLHIAWYPTARDRRPTHNSTCSSPLLHTALRSPARPLPLHTLLSRCQALAGRSVIGQAPCHSSASALLVGLLLCSVSRVGWLPELACAVIGGRCVRPEVCVITCAPRSRELVEAAGWQRPMGGVSEYEDRVVADCRVQEAG